MLDIFVGVMIPFVGTGCGAFMVFFMRDCINKKIEQLLLGFSGGVMLAASIWSLIIPAISHAESMGKLKFLPALVGLILGVLTMVVFDAVLDKNKNASKQKMIFAITLHNIPEGLAVGVALAGLVCGDGLGSVWVALSLSIGIAIQNIPEGAIVAMPLKQNGMSKSRSFLCGALSGIVEPVFAIVAILLVGIMSSVLPYVLALAAGCMIFVVVDELIPEMQGEGGVKVGTLGFMAGFLIMMVLDVVFG